MTFKPGSEDQAHYAIRQFLLTVMPGCEVVHPPNGMFAGGKTREERRKAEQHIARLKALGLTPGAPDLLVFPGDGRVFWIEVKAPGAKGASAEQAAFGLRMAALKIPWRVCRSIEDARQFLADIGIATREAAAA